MGQTRSISWDVAVRTGSLSAKAVKSEAKMSMNGTFGQGVSYDVSIYPNGTEIMKKEMIFTGDFLKKLPKSDLHLHLDGSMRLSTLIEMAKARNVTLPSYTELV